MLPQLFVFDGTGSQIHTLLKPTTSQFQRETSCKFATWKPTATIMGIEGDPPKATTPPQEIRPY